jgi:hypothetical protein
MRKKIVVLLLCLSMYIPAFSINRDEETALEKQENMAVAVFLVTVGIATAVIRMIDISSLFGDFIN